MTKQKNQALSEVDICDLFITPAVKGSDWDQPTQIRREFRLTPGPVIVRGNMSSRNRKKFADNVLLREAGVRIDTTSATAKNRTPPCSNHRKMNELTSVQVHKYTSAYSALQ